jgi:hypothetical protein
MAGRNTATMARICVKRSYFCITGVSRQIARTGADGENSHTTHCTGEGAKEEDTPQNPTKTRRFSRFDGFYYLQQGLHTARLRHYLGHISFCSFTFPLSELDRYLR